ncbi:hypothetical protein [Leptospira santarosai]|uniref:hypothetical protein n=1 Tax=Leptospira santarosai TaxID=28183 RepID=UPI000A6BAD3C|nr:hypothetical protein [Leptospira santarosai]
MIIENDLTDELVAKEVLKWEHDPDIGIIDSFLENIKGYNKDQILSLLIWRNYDTAD